VRATPTTFFVDKEGNILGGQPGFLSVQTFSNLLGFVGSGAFQKMDFKLYVQQHTKTQKK
jgi:thioredoxin-related protein